MYLAVRPIAALLVPLAVVAAPAAEPNVPHGFAPVFNGKDLTGWHGMPHFDPYQLDAMATADRQAKFKEWTEKARKHWKVQAGELVHDGAGPFLSTDKEYGDIELLFDYRTDPKTDSAIYLRATPLVLSNNLLTTWNCFRILQVGERTTVYLNDRLLLDGARMDNTWNPKLPLRKQGPIQLPTRGATGRWRNLFVREIPADEANVLLNKRDASGFVSAFNGHDFTGWAGPVENYEVQDGAVVCKPKKGGNIYTQAEYDDFIARLEFKLPPAGNNGLAIRYPGKGRPSVDAMCEIQILDDGHEKYGKMKLDPRQYTGSVYGMIPAQRGYLRPTGEWNFMEVTVFGPKIQVELNGNRILDGDVSTVSDFMGGKAHPGKDLKRGHFGFCGHNDPVAFRNIQIKRLSE